MTVLGAIDEVDQEAQLPKKFTSMKCPGVKVDESSVRAFEDETIEVQHLLAEPKTDCVSVDGVLCFDKENSLKASEINDFPYGFDYGLKRNSGGLGSRTQGQYELELGVLDGLLDEVDEVDDILAANDISGACEDFLLDVELSEKISYLDCGPLERSQLRNSSSESQSPGFSGSSNGAFMLSEASTTVSEFEGKNGSFLNCEFQDSSGEKWDRPAVAEDDVLPTSCDLENLDELKNYAKPLLSAIASNKKGKKAVRAAEFGPLPRQKRLRKPTKRYIEEFSDPKSKDEAESRKFPSALSKDKFPKIRFRNELHCFGPLSQTPKEETLIEIFSQATSKGIETLLDPKSKRVAERQKIPSVTSKDKHLKIRSRNERQVKAVKSAPKESSFAGASTDAPRELRPRRGRPNNHVSFSVLESDYEESEDDCQKKKRSKKGDRRKHQRMWTHSEVMKLIDGIAEYGTGRWTDIKNVMFSSSAYRTPIDLRDKWRNLLRASCARRRQHKKEEVEQKLKDVVRSLPSSVLRRIRELASLHPYPRFSPGGRYIRKKKDET